jgi:hypothetical protein
MDLLDKKMASHGFGHCKHASSNCYVSTSRPQCAKFIPASVEIVEKRIEWKEKL